MTSFSCFSQPSTVVKLEYIVPPSNRNDKHFRMVPDALYSLAKSLSEERRSIIACVVVLGSTEVRGGEYSSSHSVFTAALLFISHQSTEREF